MEVQLCNFQALLGAKLCRRHPIALLEETVMDMPAGMPAAIQTDGPADRPAHAPTDIPTNALADAPTETRGGTQAVPDAPGPTAAADR